MAADALQGVDLRWLAERIGTPFYVYDAAMVQARIDTIVALTAAPGLQARYAMKACSAAPVLARMRAHQIWIDAVSGNEVLRAQAAGYPLGAAVPEVMLTTDVFRDNALDVVRDYGVLPNIGSPHMLDQLAAAGYRGPLGIRLNPGFGHGHVQSCDTGGPSSKHGVWHDDLSPVREAAARAGFPIGSLHAHVGTGPQPGEFEANMRRLVDAFVELIPSFPDARAVNLGGGIPHPYRPGQAPFDLNLYRPILVEAREELARAAGRPVR